MSTASGIHCSTNLAWTRVMTIGQQNTAQLNILVVEDNLVNQRVVVGLLTKHGHRVTLANNGREALAALEKDRFHIVLMDVQMPEMDGLEATALIRERERLTGEHVCIIATTAHAMKGDRERCLKSGMDAYLPKPIAQQALFDAIEGVRSSAATAPESALPASALDFGEMRQRLGDDEELIADIIRLFLADYPLRLDAITSAIEASDPDRIRREAHTLKGGASNLSALGVVEAARALEMLGSPADRVTVDAHFARLVAEVEHLATALRELQAGMSLCGL